MVNKYFDKIVPEQKKLQEIDKNLIENAITLKDRVDKNIESLDISSALEEIIELCRKCNKYIDETEPWVLAKSDELKERLGTVLYNLLDSIRIVSTMLIPFLPTTSDLIFKELNIDINSFDKVKEFNVLKSETTLNEPVILFNRVDKKEKLGE